MYAVYIATSEKVERLFLIDPRLLVIIFPKCVWQNANKDVFIALIIFNGTLACFELGKGIIHSLNSLER